MGMVIRMRRMRRQGDGAAGLSGWRRRLALLLESVDGAQRSAAISSLGGKLQAGDTMSAADLLEQTAPIQGLHELASHAQVSVSDPAPTVASAVEFVIEGLYAQKKISRSDEWQYQATPTRPRDNPTAEQLFDTDVRIPRGKKKYYN